MRLRPRSIIAKFMLVFLAAAVLPLGLLGLVFYGNSTRAVADMVGNRTSRIARSLQSDLDERLQRRMQDRILSANQPLHDYLAAVRAPDAAAAPGLGEGFALRRYLSDLFVEYGAYYDELVVADARGEPLLRHDRAATTFLAGRTSVRMQTPPPAPQPPAGASAPAPGLFGGTRAPAAPEFEAGDRALLAGAGDLADGASRMTLDRAGPGGARGLAILTAVQSRDRPQERLGYVLARLRPEYLWPEDWATRAFGEMGQLAVVDARSGDVLYHTRPEWVGRPLGQVDPDLDEALRAAARPRPGAPAWVPVRGPGGRRAVAALDVAGMPWRVVATAVPGEFAAEVRRSALLNLLIATLALLVAALLLSFAGRRVSRSIQTLTAGARRLAAGDWNAPPIRAETHDEVETLAEAFNVMTESVRRNIAMREEAAAELDALNRSLERRVAERTQRLEELNAALERANRELQELDRLKSNFLATVSHEFKTPLTSIKAFAEIVHDELEERHAPEDLRRFLKIIDAESDRLARLIKNVLDLSRIESGRMIWRTSDFPAREVVDATVDGLLPGLREKRIRLDREPPPAETVIRGDPDRIQEVLTNVLDNAIQASGEGQRIVIGWRALEEPSNGPPRLARFSIRDEGHGIPGDQIERIFDRFHQVGVHGRRRKGGTGLGLAICREIAEHHGGRIWAESEPGRGSTFHITLPLASASHPPDASPDSPRPPGGHPGEPDHA